MRTAHVTAALLAALLAAGCAAPAPTTNTTHLSPAAATSAPSPTASQPVIAVTAPGINPPGVPVLRYLDGDRVFASGGGALVYVRGSNLCLQQAGQTPVFLHDAAGLEWAGFSDDGQRVAFQMQAYQPVTSGWVKLDELWAANADGSGAHRVAGGADLAPKAAPGADLPIIAHMAWLPGTHQVVLTTSERTTYEALRDTLLRVDLDSGEVKVLLKPGKTGAVQVADSGGAEAPIPSPDGAQVAVVRYSAGDPTSQDSITIVNADGSHARKDIFTYPTYVLPAAAYTYVTPTWSPDSRGLWVALPPRDSPGLTVTYVDAQTGQTRPGGWFPNADSMWLPMPVVSPDGTSVFYSGAIGGVDGRYILDTASGAVSTRLALDEDVLGWQPDSRQLIAQGDDGPLLVDTASGEPRPEFGPPPTPPTPTAAPVTPSPYSAPEPAHPDDAVMASSGGSLAYVKAGQLCLRQGGGTPALVRDAAGVKWIGFSDDGQRVAFTVETTAWDTWFGAWDTVDELWAAGADGAGARKLASSTQFEQSAAGGDLTEYPQISQLAWLPGTHRILLTNFSWVGLASEPSNDLISVDADRGQVTTIVPIGKGGADFTPSPDGRQVAMVKYLGKPALSKDTISLVNSDGTDLRPNVFTYRTYLSILGGMQLATPTWLPDSSGLWLALPQPDGDSDYSTPQHAPSPLVPPWLTVWKLGADGSLSVVREFKNTGPGNQPMPVVSPDGKYVFFRGMIDGAYSMTVLDMASGAAVSRMSTEDDVYTISWLPGSRQLRGVRPGGSLIIDALTGQTHPEFPAVPDQGCGPS